MNSDKLLSALPATALAMGELALLAGLILVSW